MASVEANLKRAHLSWWGPVLVIACSTAVAVLFGFTADDAYIVARYATNLYRSHELVFNPGEYVSALTAPAEALLLWGLHYLSADPLTLYKMLSLAGAMATLVTVALIRLQDPSRRTGFLLLTAGSPFVLMWSVGGLETPMLLVVATWAASLCFKEISPAGFRAVLTLGAIGFVIRYDSVLFFAPVIAVMGWHLLARKALSPVAFLPLLIPIGWLVFSNAYFGDVLPTSFYVKTPSFKPLQLLKAVGYEASFVVVSGIWLTCTRKLTLKSCLAVLQPRPAMASLGFALMLVLLYGLSAGTKHMMFGYRLFVPYLPALVLLLMHVSREAAGDHPQTRNVLIAMTQASMCLLVWQLTLNPTLLTPTPWQRYEYSRVSLKSYAGDFLPVLDRNARSIAAHWRGVEASAVRGPRIVTFAAGRLPYLMQDAYVYEVLVSYRKHCKQPWENHADYVQVLYPSHGSREEQLRDVYLHGTRISDELISFSGAVQHFEVWFNPRPKANIIPDRVSGPCVASDDASMAGGMR